MNSLTHIEKQKLERELHQVSQRLEEIEEVCPDNSVLLWGELAFNRFGLMALGRGLLVAGSAPGYPNHPPAAKPYYIQQMISKTHKSVLKPLRLHDSKQSGREN